MISLTGGDRVVSAYEDGIVSWESCVSDEPLGTNAEVRGKHMVICGYPEVVSLVSRRLAHP